MLIVLLARTVIFCFFFVFTVYVAFYFSFLVVSNSAIDCLERLVSEITCYVSSGTLNPTHFLTHPSSAESCAEQRTRVFVAYM